MCAYASDAGLLWCCDPHDEYVSACSPGPGRLTTNEPAVNRYCWGGTQACKGNRGGMDQIYCEKGGATWCCNKKYESCTDVQGQINVCVPKTFRNPVADGPVSLASASYTLTTILPSTIRTSTGSSTVSSTMATITRSGKGTGPSESSDSSGGTAAPITTPTADGPGEAVREPTPPINTSQAIETSIADSQQQSLSVGAVSGIVLGGLSGVALLCFTLYFLGKRREKLKVSRGEDVKEQEIVRNRTWSDKETFVGAEVRSYTVTKWDSQIGSGGGRPGHWSAGRGPSVWGTTIVNGMSELEADVPVSEMPAGTCSGSKLK
ncbi:hypothetical protein C7212DRAFT_358937 [Tuber magnatum]|uniref:Uncharacterized protein n=1 Tax=Tuber magnatum TaxID=42249 RepID=A0A317SMT6_9PEZI|nr:hypothetical protein C7212DRAFT_358937 [Tuber magnatum]